MDVALVMMKVPPRTVVGSSCSGTVERESSGNADTATAILSSQGRGRVLIAVSIPIVATLAIYKIKGLTGTALGGRELIAFPTEMISNTAAQEAF